MFQNVPNGEQIGLKLGDEQKQSIGWNTLILVEQSELMVSEASPALAYNSITGVPYKLILQK